MSALFIEPGQLGGHLGCGGRSPGFVVCATRDDSNTKSYHWADVVF
jgi:hypothetical protein